MITKLFELRALRFLSAELILREGWELAVHIRIVVAQWLLGRIPLHHSHGRPNRAPSWINKRSSVGDGW
jgi:hypothetical protein